jgi:hypothetical protein
MRLARISCAGLGLRRIRDRRGTSGWSATAPPHNAPRRSVSSPLPYGRGLAHLSFCPSASEQPHDEQQDDRADEGHDQAA